MKNKFELVCGVEAHVQLSTASKMFCACRNDPFHALKPNVYTCPTCLGLPGSLPTINRQAVLMTINLGLMMGCQVNLFSKFDRKHYFYPDLPKGYQISQYDQPLCYNGRLETDLGLVKINRIHLEEDTGKLLHKKVKGRDVSLVDFNRSGVPLVEIVAEPVIHSAEEAVAYTRRLKETVLHLGISGCNMERGELRLEANVSLREKGSDKLPNYKVEVKNLNSFNFLDLAINYEIERQRKLLQKGHTPKQETRGWDIESSRTFSQRSKESAVDYQYLPDPDLPPMEFTEKEIEELKSNLPKSLSATRKLWRENYKIETHYIKQLSKNPNLVDWSQQVFQLAEKSKIPPNDIAKALVNKTIRVKLSSKPSQVIKTYQSAVSTVSFDTKELEKVIGQALSENPDVVSKYKQGDTKVLGFLMGQVMRQLPKNSDPHQVRQALQDRLKQA